MSSLGIYRTGFLTDVPSKTGTAFRGSVWANRFSDRFSVTS